MAAAASAAQHRFVETNGIKLHIAEMGSGPIVVLLHGFPESWYSWRHQLQALADAGYHAIAPSLRGFGLTECPVTPSGEQKMALFDSVGDLVGLIYHLGGAPVFVVGHDVGASVGWGLCLLRPDLVKAYVSIGIPFIKPGSAAAVPVEGFYVNRFAIPGRAEKDFGRFDTATVLKKIYTLFKRSELQIAGPDEEVLDIVRPSETAPSWCTEPVLKMQAEIYDKSGFEGPLWFTYRNHQRRAEMMTPWLNVKITTPVLYITGEDDYVRKFPQLEQYLHTYMKSEVPQLQDVITLPGGHFVPEDSPDLVNAELLKFFQTFNG